MESKGGATRRWRSQGGVTAALVLATWTTGCSGLLRIDDRTLDPLDGTDSGEASAAIVAEGSQDAQDATLDPEASPPVDEAALDARTPVEASVLPSGAADATVAAPMADASLHVDANSIPSGLGDAQARDAQARDAQAGDGQVGYAQAGDASDAAPLMDGSPCSNTATNPHHCGQCGHDCLGGACSGGSCQPVELVASDAGLAPFGLAEDDNALYWTDRQNNFIERTDKNTGTTTRIWTTASAFPEPIAVDDAGVFWGESSGIWQCPKGGCPLRPGFVAVTPQHVHELALDDQSVFWTDDSAGAVLSAPKYGPAAGRQTLWSSDAAVPYAIKTDGQRVYFGADDSRLYFVASDGGGGAQAIGQAGTEAILGIALQDGEVYWTHNSAYNIGKETIWSASTNSLAPAAIVRNEYLPGSIATDGSRIFWLNFTQTDNGDLRACPIAGCTHPTVLAAGIVNPRSVVVDGRAVYWTDEGPGGGGSLWKLAK